MPQLEELYLDNCNIRDIHPNTFTNLPLLQVLSLQHNPLHVLPEAALLPSLKTLKIGIKTDDESCSSSDDNEYFKFLPDTFSKYPMENLKNLEIHNANFGNLTDYHFGGLTHLERLSLDGCKFQGRGFRSLGTLESRQNF